MNIRTELCFIINFYYFQYLVVSMGLKERMGQIWEKVKKNNNDRGKLNNRHVRQIIDMFVPVLV